MQQWGIGVSIFPQVCTGSQNPQNYNQPQQPTALCKAAPLLNTRRHYFSNITIRMNRGTKLFSPCVSFRSS